MTLIDLLPRFKYRDLKPLIDFGFKHDKPVRLENALELAGRSYTIAFIPQEYELIFKWEDDEGNQRKAKVYLRGVTTEQYRGKYVWYFVCPYTGRSCRKLFTDGKVLASRYAFPHTYSSRNKSHHQRDMEKLFRRMDTAQATGGELAKFQAMLFSRVGRPRKR